MGKYRIVGARPKGATNHVNSEFNMYELDAAKERWVSIGWKSINQLSDLIRAKHEVLTGKIVDGAMSSGAPVELELRIAKNDTEYRISEMPDT